MRLQTKETGNLFVNKIKAYITPELIENVFMCMGNGTRFAFTNGPGVSVEFVCVHMTVFMGHTSL